MNDELSCATAGDALNILNKKVKETVVMCNICRNNQNTIIFKKSKTYISLKFPFL